MKLNEFKQKAFDTFAVESTEVSFSDPISFLYSMKWNMPTGPAFLEEQMTVMNINFSDAGCFGRAVKAAVLSEQFFPGHTLYCGEVGEDLLRGMLLQQVSVEKWNDETFIAELLQYENPHIVLVDEKGNQFDPIFKQLSSAPQHLFHPSILKHDLWKGLHCAYLVSSALLYREADFKTYKALLEESHSLCPELILAKENLAAMYCFSDKHAQSVKLALEVLEERKDAKNLMFLYMLTQDAAYKKRIIDEYDEKMFTFLTQIFKV